MKLKKLKAMKNKKFTIILGARCQHKNVDRISEILQRLENAKIKQQYVYYKIGNTLEIKAFRARREDVSYILATLTRKYKVIHLLGITEQPLELETFYEIKGRSKK